MEQIRKSTIERPADLINKAQETTGSGITETVPAGLQLPGDSRAYADLRQLRGKVRLSRTRDELKADR